MAVESTSARHPSALSGARFLLSTRVEEIEASVGRLELRLEGVRRKRGELSDRLEAAEITWSHIVNNLARFDPAELDRAFEELASLRSEAATLEERSRDLGSRIADMRSEISALRGVQSSLEEMQEPAEIGTEGSDRVRSASRQVFSIIEEERMRIARDMHDGPAQAMANLVLQAEILERLLGRDPKLVLQELDDFKAGVRGVLDETRRLIFDLRPMTLDDLGLVPTLRKFLPDYQQKTGITAHLRVSGEEVRLPVNLDPTLFRIIQEALNNARKHARAKTVEVTIAFQSNKVSATVKDDGIGFDVATTEARLDANRNLGMISMRERADLEKGQIQIRSQIGKGTEVRVTFTI